MNEKKIRNHSSCSCEELLTIFERIEKPEEKRFIEIRHRTTTEEKGWLNLSEPSKKRKRTYKKLIREKDDENQLSGENDVDDCSPSLSENKMDDDKDKSEDDEKELGDDEVEDSGADKGVTVETVDFDEGEDDHSEPKDYPAEEKDENSKDSEDSSDSEGDDDNSHDSSDSDEDDDDNENEIEIDEHDIWDELALSEVPPEIDCNKLCVQSKNRSVIDRGKIQAVVNEVLQGGLSHDERVILIRLLWEKMK